GLLPPVGGAGFDDQRRLPGDAGGDDADLSRDFGEDVSRSGAGAASADFAFADGQVPNRLAGGPREVRAMGKRVVVVGGGLAGMAAAVALESAGQVVTLIEARKTLGGRAGSFEDPQTGEILDNCQHVLLGCCTNLLDFYRRIGVQHL